MSQTLQAKGYIFPPSAGGFGTGCGDCGSEGGAAVAPFEIALRSCSESYQQARSGKFSIGTLPSEFVPLPLTDGFDVIQLLAIKASAAITLRLYGKGAKATSSASWPTALLAGQMLGFTLDGVNVALTFVSGDDTALEVAARINGASVVAGLSYLPARVELGQVVVEGRHSGAQGALSTFSGAAATTLGLNTFPGAMGGGSDVQVEGLFIAQFPRVGDLSRVEVSGTASVTVLAAGT